MTVKRFNPYVRITCAWKIAERKAAVFGHLGVHAVIRVFMQISLSHCRMLRPVILVQVSFRMQDLPLWHERADDIMNYARF
jgi:hypothetical protein